MQKRPTNRPAQIVDQDVVIPDSAFGIEQDSIEDIDDGPNLDFEPGFFDHLSRQAGLQRFAQFEPAAREAPLSRQRFEAALHQNHFPFVEDDTAHADDRLGGVLPRRTRGGIRRHFLFRLEGQRMDHATLPMDQPLFNPELVVPGGRGNLAVHTRRPPAPFNVHRAGLDPRDHPDVTPCGTREHGGDLTLHRVLPKRHRLARVIRGTLVVEGHEAVEISGVERVEPAADEVKRVGGHQMRYFTGMRSHTTYLSLNIPSKMAFRNITPEVDDAIRASGIQEGLVLVNTMHITASVFINDDERGLHHDFGKWLEELAPFNPDPNHYHHNRTGEDNADAHLKRQIMGREVVVAVTKGKLDFGPWEQIFYGEFDGSRTKKILIKVIGE